MTEIYGHRWVSSYGKIPNESWTLVLAGFEAEYIKRGIDRMLGANLEWPPTLTEFVNYCRESQVDPCHRTMLLPRRSVNRELGLKKIAELRALMRSKSS